MLRDLLGGDYFTFDMFRRIDGSDSGQITLKQLTDWARQNWMDWVEKVKSGDSNSQIPRKDPRNQVIFYS